MPKKSNKGEGYLSFDPVRKALIRSSLKTIQPTIVQLKTENKVSYLYKI